MSGYYGPDRRTDELAALQSHFDRLIEAQTEHFDGKIAAVTDDVAALRAEVRPVVNVYTAATVGATIWKGVLGALAALGTVALAVIGLYSWLVGSK